MICALAMGTVGVIHMGIGVRNKLDYFTHPIYSISVLSFCQYKICKFMCDT